MILHVLKILNTKFETYIQVYLEIADFKVKKFIHFFLCILSWVQTFNANKLE